MALMLQLDSQKWTTFPFGSICRIEAYVCVFDYVNQHRWSFSTFLSFKKNLKYFFEVLFVCFLNGIKPSYVNLMVQNSLHSLIFPPSGKTVYHRGSPKTINILFGSIHKMGLMRHTQGLSKMHINCGSINILFRCQYATKDVILNSQPDQNYKNWFTGCHW